MSRQEFTVLITHAIPKDGLEELFESCRVYYPETRAFDTEQMLRLLPECDGVLAGGAITRKMIQAAARLRIISNYGAGYDQVDVAAADEAGVIVTNIPDATTESTAELAFGLMLSVRRRITELDEMVRTMQGSQVFGMGRHMGHNLSGSTLGIIGMGRIGKRMRQMARGFGMRVIYHNRRRVEGLEADWRTPEELFSEADVISLHCPLTDETRNLMDRSAFAQMKKGAVLINTARGGVVNSDALIEALENGQIGGAGIDVYPDEPNVPDALKKMPNVVLTPHIGTNTFEARHGMAQAAAERILAVRDGQMPQNIVNRNLRKRK